MWRAVSKSYLLRPLCSHIRSIFSSTMGEVDVNKIVWIDLEMTGLDIEKDTIMEIACVVTDSNLNIVAEGPNLIIHTPEEKLSQMNEWCINQHTKSGLTEAAKNSTISLESAEDTIMNFIETHVVEKHSPLAGSSVYMDKLFIKKYMPKLDEYLHYRIIDTSTIKELCRRWNKELYKASPKKEYSHRALNDIKESIDELKFYRDNFFITKL